MKIPAGVEREIAAHFRRYNNAPQDSFCGLSPVQMGQLLYQPLTPGCVVQLRNPVPTEVLDQVPFLRLTEAFLHLLHRERVVKLTPLGALPLKYLRELYGHGFILEDYIEDGHSKLNREQDSVVLTTLHITTTLAGLARKAHGRLSLTKKGEQLLAPAQRQMLWALVLHTFTDRFNWAYHDGYPSPTAAQKGWAYSVYLLARFGDVTWPVSFYADYYQRAFPILLADFKETTYSASPTEQLATCYGTRTFERSLNWLGLIAPEPGVSWFNLPRRQLTATPLLAQLFEVQQGPEPVIL